MQNVAEKKSKPIMNVHEATQWGCQTLSSSAFVPSPLYGPSCSPSLVD